MQRNVAGQKIQFFAFDITDGSPKTGDAANLTAYVSLDGGGVTGLADTSAAELSASNAPGWYQFDVAQGESDAASALFTCKSATADVSVVGRPVTTTPANASLQSIDGNGRVDVIKIAGTTQTARDLGASVLLSPGTGTGQVKLASGYVAPDWGDIGNKTTTNALTGTTLSTSQVVASVTGAVGSVTGAVGSVTGNVGGNVTGSVGSVVGNVGGSVASVAGNVGGNVVGSVGSVTGNVGGTINGFTATAQGQIQDEVEDGLTAYGAATASDVAATEAALAADIAALPTGDENADALLARNVAGGSSAGRTVKQALYRLRNKVAVAAGTATVYGVDDTTSSWTAAVTTTPSDPVTTVDPA